MFVSIDSDARGGAHALALDKAGREMPPGFPLRLRPGQTLFHQGDEARTVFRVTEGVFRLARVSARGRQQVIAFGFPGDILGLPVRGCRNTDCEALTAASLRVLPARADGSSGETAFLAAAALHEIGAMHAHLTTLGRKSSREKVAAFLLAVLHRTGRMGDTGLQVDLPMSRGDIAEFLGLRTETVSRAFTDLRRRGIIALPSAQEVTVRDATALRALAESD